MHHGRQRTPLQDTQLLGSGFGVNPGFDKLRMLNQSSERAAQHLATLTERGAHQTKQHLGGHHRRINRRLRVSHNRHQRRIDLWLWQKHRWRHDTDHFGRSPIRNLHRHRSVDFGTRGSSKPLTDLFLHHHQHACDERLLIKQVADQRHTDVVRQVGHHGVRNAIQHSGPISLHCIAFNHLHAQRFDLAPKDRQHKSV